MNYAWQIFFSMVGSHNSGQANETVLSLLYIERRCNLTVEESSSDHY